jgi:Protein chain release factor A
MRAETQNNVDAIQKSLNLLAQRMDYETARYRLEEFDARVEDPTLWDDPDAAQKLMRDRQVLVDTLTMHDTIKQELADNIELIEMGEMEGDADIITEAEEALKSLRDKAAQKTRGAAGWRGGCQ